MSGAPCAADPAGGQLSPASWGLGSRGLGRSRGCACSTMERGARPRPARQRAGKGARSREQAAKHGAAAPALTPAKRGCSGYRGCDSSCGVSASFHPLDVSQHHHHAMAALRLPACVAQRAWASSFWYRHCLHHLAPLKQASARPRDVSRRSEAHTSRG